MSFQWNAVIKIKDPSVANLANLGNQVTERLHDYLGVEQDDVLLLAAGPHLEAVSKIN